jgi:hypothetical protein
MSSRSMCQGCSFRLLNQIFDAWGMNLTGREEESRIDGFR